MKKSLANSEGDKVKHSKKRIAIILLIALVIFAGVGYYAYDKVYLAPVRQAKQKEINKEKTEKEANEKRIRETPDLEEPNADKIFALVNEERTKRGIKPLIRSNIMDKSAEWKLNDMVKYDYYEHLNPITGTFVNLNIVGDLCEYTSENINMLDRYIRDKATDPNYNIEYAKLNESTVNSWMKSTKGHREAILNPKYLYGGVSVGVPKYVPDNSHRYIYVFHFCAPR